ncbi:ethanolamine ammonia-lyase subunit EutC [Sporosarcina sp. CAU 1771]
MNEELIASITKLVVERLNDDKQTKQPEVALRDNKSVGQPIIEQLNKTSNDSLISIKPLVTKEVKSVPTSTSIRKPTAQSEDALAKKEQQLEEMRKKTPSRIAVGRTGTGSRPRTDTWLKFRYDHAAAVDAVYGEVDPSILKNLDIFSVETRVADKEEYIRRPDYGRKLSDESKKTVLERCEKSPTVQIVISNGLSASAVETNIEDVYLSLKQSLSNLNIPIGTTFYVDKGRVALMDEIGDLLTPDVVIILIGERPGLVSADSLSAYLCYKPRSGAIEADRMVVSNIHKGGIPPVEAGAYLGTVIQKVLKYEASGVKLVEKEG